MKKTVKKIKKHFSEKKQHYKLALLLVVLFAIFFFAHTAGDGAYQKQSAESVTEEVEEEQSNISCEGCSKEISKGYKR
ncbi:MAG: hypothetical protein Q8N77_04000 [Nanoarchaeota archaeon]|nr:hypothetical protein [Nanoarchaeota archaeon]